MAIRPPGDIQQQPPQQTPDKGQPSRSQRSNRSAQRPAPKPGIHAEEEHDLEHQQHLQRLQEQQRVQQTELKAKPRPVEELNKQLRENRERENRNMGGGSAGSGGGAQGRADQARSKGFQTTPGLAEFVSGQAAPKTGSSFAELMPGARARGPELPEPDMRPPPFLSTFEGMKDIYLRVKGRASPKTRELLEGPALEDLVKMVVAIQEDEGKAKAADGRLIGALHAKLKADPGPLLLGLNDPRLHEPWRLFLDGWELWVPDKKADKHGSGIELFLEGEGEDDTGEPIEILQVLRLIGSELTLETKLGPQSDRLSYDGERFFRLKSDAKEP